MAERREDIEPNLDYELERNGRDEGRDALAALLGERLAPIDLFDRVQLEHVLAVCRESASLSDAGRKLFAVSRQGKKQSNDADRLRKYLARFDIEWSEVVGR